MTAVDPAVPVSELRAKGLREADARAVVSALKARWDGLPGRLAPHIALDDVKQELRALLAAHTPEGAEGEREHVWPCPHFYVGMAAYDPARRCSCPATEADPTAGERRKMVGKDGAHNETAECAPFGCVPAEPDAGDVEALARMTVEVREWYSMIEDNHYRNGDLDTSKRQANAAEFDRWLASRDAATADRARREGAVEALRAVADEWLSEHDGEASHVARFLRARGDRLETP